MFDAIKKGLANMALKTVREKFMSQYLEGIGTVQKFSCEQGKIYLTIILAGLEDRPIDIVCKSIQIAEDGSSVKVSEFESNMPFAKAALDRYATRSFEIPPGKARLAIDYIKKAFGF